MRKITRLSLSLVALFSFTGVFADKPVKITVDWEDNSYEYKVEVYDPANNLILTICNNNIPDPNNPVSQCYTASGTEEIYTATYDLGCIQNGTYYIRLFSVDDDSWSSNNDVIVDVDGTIVINDDGNNASDTGYDINFSVSGGGSSCSQANVPDTDGDGVIDRVDLDDDNDGIPDADEGLGINSFDCTIPALNFAGNNNTPEVGTAGQVGAIYRFENAIFGEPYDVLVEITEIRNAALINIDDDTVDNENYLQTRLEFTGNETPADCAGCDYPGITFQFTIVDAGTSTPAATLFRIGGTTWDVDGPPDRRESVRYYGPSAYGTDNPTTIEVTDVNGDNSVIEMTAGGILEGPGFSTIPQLRSYFQFLSNTFTLRMQNVRTTFTATNAREYGMSFTQCDVLDFESASIIIVNGRDNDGDGYDNHIDLDSDNDGIPDNVEIQPTVGYIAPSNIHDPISGLDINYPTSFTYIDTDGDLIFDYLDTDSDGDGTPDIEENGMANAIVSPNDPDKDGLDTIFETNGNETGQTPFDVNEDIEDPTDLSILPDTDGDLALGGDLDYRDAIDVYLESASVDFDGIDDHLSLPGFVTGFPEVTLMAWVNASPLNAGTTNTLLGEDVSCRLILTSTNTVQFSVRTDTSPTSGVADSMFNYNEWHHVTGTFDGTTGEQRLYIDGVLVNSASTGFTGVITPTAFSNGNFEIGRHARNIGDQEYFTGSIDEVRVFNKALSEEQVQQIVYQEIENNGGFMKGKSIDKNIIDNTTSTQVPWSNLQAYYPMSNILTGKTTDASTYSRDADLRNIFSVQPQTAPMPYETIADGPWTTEGTWLHGNVWDIEDVANNKPWSIVHIKNNITTTDSHTQLGMLIDSGSKLTVSGDNAIANNWYLQLDGTLDLLGDSQLVQGMNSDLVTSATGRVLRRQQGNSNVYWYNYWSSPVGALGATTLSNNNGPSNNTNNTPFNIAMLEDGSGNPFTFTSSFDDPGSISNRWLYSYLNGQTFWDWTALTPSSAIAPGVGYTQKGTGNPGTEQEYIFNGKPNNGTILVQADDIDGDSGNESEQDVTLTTTFVGNPYPSAIDARQFIADNVGVTGGSVYVWEQWAGTSHILEEYQGGYGTINNVTTEVAYQWNDPTQTGSPLARRPTFHIPVGQGFFVEVVNDGDNSVLSNTDDIEFNNGQRVFIRESDADGTDPNNGSVFFRSNGQSSQEASENNTMSMMRLQLGVSNGNKRSFVLAFSDLTTDGFDYGYDARTIDPQDDDMNSFIGDQKMLIQSFSPITEDKVVDLVFNSTGSYDYTLEISELNGIDENQQIYLRDNLNGTYHDLRNGSYGFSSDANGEDKDRFDIVFKEEQTLSDEQTTLDDMVIFANENRLYVKGLQENVAVLTLTNTLGQTVKSFVSPNSGLLENGVFLGELSTGVYMVNLVTDSNLSLEKKIILK